MTASARPRVVFCTCNDPRTHRIALNITDRRPGMRFIESTRVWSRLPDVAGLVILLVELCGVNAVAIPEHFRNRILVLGNANDMDMIGHYAI